jgi:arsenate reductase
MPSVVFLCVANSARSQMAEAFARASAPAGWEVYSAGSRPTQLNPLVTEVLDEVNIDSSGQRSKSMDHVPLLDADWVITLCAEEECPVGVTRGRKLHWPLPDPAAAPSEHALETFRNVRDRIRERIQQFWQEAATR